MILRVSRCIYCREELRMRWRRMVIRLVDKICQGDTQRSDRLFLLEYNRNVFSDISSSFIVLNHSTIYQYRALRQTTEKRYKNQSIIIDTTHQVFLLEPLIWWKIHPILILCQKILNLLQFLNIFIIPFLITLLQYLRILIDHYDIMP